MQEKCEGNHDGHGTGSMVNRMVGDFDGQSLSNDNHHLKRSDKTMFPNSLNQSEAHSGQSE